MDPKGNIVHVRGETEASLEAVEYVLGKNGYVPIPSKDLARVQAMTPDERRRWRNAQKRKRRDERKRTSKARAKQRRR